MIKKELIGTKEKEQTLANIQFFTNLENATEGAGLAVEAVSEQVEIKLPLFKQLDACCAPDTILASNTSSISISQLAAATKKPKNAVRTEEHTSELKTLMRISYADSYLKNKL